MDTRIRKPSVEINGWPVDYIEYDMAYIFPEYWHCVSLTLKIKVSKGVFNEDNIVDYKNFDTVKIDDTLFYVFLVHTLTIDKDVVKIQLGCAEDTFHLYPTGKAYTISIDGERVPVHTGDMVKIKWRKDNRWRRETYNAVCISDTLVLDQADLLVRGNGVYVYSDLDGERIGKVVRVYPGIERHLHKGKEEVEVTGGPV